MTARDRIELRGLRVFAHHGVFDFERADGQDFVIDVTVGVDLSAAAAGDALAETIHYGVLAQRVAAAVQRDPVDLIETVAQRVLRVALSFGAAEWAEVAVHKPSAPIPLPFDDVAVRMTRTRAELPLRRAVVALGGNLGDRRATLTGALEALDAVPGARVTAVSSAYETPALRLDGVDEEAPAYLNAVAVVATVLDAADLLRHLQGIERAAGRDRSPDAERWGDRPLDLDLIQLGDLVVETDDLVVPHPRAHERGFVLVPWADADPEASLLGFGPVASLAQQVLAATGERVDRREPLEWRGFENPRPAEDAAADAVGVEGES